MELQGKIIEVLPEKTISARGENFKIGEFVLETIDDRYPHKMLFSVFGEERLKRFNIQDGQQVIVSFDIDARKYQERWFNSIRAFDVRPILADVQQPVPPVAAAPGVPPFDQPAPQQAAPASQPQQPQQMADPFAVGGDSDDLPF